MKKLSFVLLFLLTATLLFGCNNSVSESPSEIVGNGISWSENTVDSALVGAWQIEGDEKNEYYIFTENGKIRIARGSVYFEGDVTYGIDTEGNHKYFSEFYYMAGELTYVTGDGKAIFVDDEGVTQTLVKVEYTAPELAGYKDFNAENPLVGSWYNEEYKDSYTFTADGKAVYEMNDTEKSCLYHIDYTYSEADGYINFTYDAGEGTEQSSDAYKITGDTLNITGMGEYTRK